MVSINCLFFTPEPSGNDHIWRSHIFQTDGSTTNTSPLPFGGIDSYSRSIRIDWSHQSQNVWWGFYGNPSSWSIHTLLETNISDLRKKENHRLKSAIPWMVPGSLGDTFAVNHGWLDSVQGGLVPEKYAWSQTKVASLRGSCWSWGVAATWWDNNPGCLVFLSEIILPNFVRIKVTIWQAHKVFGQLHLVLVKRLWEAHQKVNGANGCKWMQMAQIYTQIGCVFLFVALLDVFWSGYVLGDGWAESLRPRGCESQGCPGDEGTGTQLGMEDFSLDVNPSTGFWVKNNLFREKVSDHRLPLLSNCLPMLPLLEYKWLLLLYIIIYYYILLLLLLLILIDCYINVIIMHGIIDDIDGIQYHFKHHIYL